MDLVDLVANVPDAVRLLTKGERGPTLAVPVSSSASVLARDQRYSSQKFIPESDSKTTAPSSSSSDPASEPNSIL